MSIPLIGVPMDLVGSTQETPDGTMERIEFRAVYPGTDKANAPKLRVGEKYAAQIKAAAKDGTTLVMLCSRWWDKGRNGEDGSEYFRVHEIVG